MRRDNGNMDKNDPKSLNLNGADGGTRTLTGLPPQDFKSCVSTGSTTSASVVRPLPFCHQIAQHGTIPCCRSDPSHRPLCMASASTPIMPRHSLQGDAPPTCPRVQPGMAAVRVRTRTVLHVLAADGCPSPQGILSGQGIETTWHASLLLTNWRTTAERSPRREAG
jgi:hypothetical protein